MTSGDRMMFLNFDLLAMGAPTEGAQQSPWHFPIMLMIMFGIFYFMLLRPQQRREKERRDLLKNVKKGDKILFSGGIIGNVVEAKDKTLIVRIGDNTNIEVARGAVHSVLEDGEIDESVLQQR